MFSAFKHHGAVLGVFNGKMVFKCYTEFSDSIDTMVFSTMLGYVCTFNAHDGAQ